MKVDYEQNKNQVSVYWIRTIEPRTETEITQREKIEDNGMIEVNIKLNLPLKKTSTV